MLTGMSCFFPKYLTIFLHVSVVGPSILPPIPVETFGSGSGSADLGSGSASGGHSEDLSGSGDQVLSGSADMPGSGDQVVSGDLSGSGDLGLSGDTSGSGDMSASGPLSGLGDSSGSGEPFGTASTDFPSGESGFGSADASGSAFSGEGSSITVVFSGMDGMVSGQGSTSGGLQEAGEGSTGIIIFPPSEAGSGLLSGSGDLSGSGSGSMESGSSTESYGESGQFSGTSSGFITSDFSGSSGLPSGFSSGTASGQSGELSGSGDTQILLIDGELIDASTSVTRKEYELGGGLVAFSGSGDISGSGMPSSDFSGSVSGSDSGFYSGVTFVGSGYTELTGSSSGEQEASGFLLYSSGLGSGDSLYGFGSTSFISGSGSGWVSGSESSTSGEEGSVTFLSGDFTTEVSGGSVLPLELGQGSLEYSGDESGSSSSSSGFHSGSGDNRMLEASGTSSGATSGDLPPVELSSPSRQWMLTESTPASAEALGEAEPAQSSDVMYGTHSPAVAPVGLAAPPTAAAPATVGAPGIAGGTNGEQSKSTSLSRYLLVSKIPFLTHCSLVCLKMRVPSFSQIQIFRQSVIHPLSICTWGCRGSGAYPSYLMVKVGYTLDKLPVYGRANPKRQAAIHTHTCRQAGVPWGEPMQEQREHANSRQRGPSWNGTCETRMLPHRNSDSYFLKYFAVVCMSFFSSAWVPHSKESWVDR